MIILKLFDRNGTELNLGDIVKISDGKRFVFFSEVKYLESEKVIAPFHTFCFHSFEKVDKVPENAKLNNKCGYDYWFIYFDEAEEDKDAETFDQYLRSWKDCEYLIDKRAYQIHKIEDSQLKLF